MSKTIVKIKGGMGNQMFQYAFARALEDAAKKHGEPIDLAFDMSFFANPPKGDTPRPLLLNVMNTELPLATSKECRKAHYPFGLLSKIAEKIKRIVVPNFYVSYFPELLHRPFHRYYEGFWQSEKYFFPITDRIRKEFTLIKPMSTGGEKFRAMVAADPYSVSIFYRRTDYVGHANLDIGEQGYQRLAIAKMRELVPDMRLYVMSDDIGWVKRNADLPANSVFISSPEVPPHEEIFLMAACKHNIIPNSSFGWWGGWLNTNPNKIVLMPKVWSKATGPERCDDIYPDGWIRI